MATVGYVLVVAVGVILAYSLRIGLNTWLRRRAYARGERRAHDALPPVRTTRYKVKG